MQHLLKKGACVLAFFVGVSSVAADVTLSQSNSPRAVLDAELVDLLDRERTAFGSVQSGQFSRLQNEPSRSAMVGGTQSFSYSRDYLAKLPEAKGDAQWYCLSEALYFEARGESVIGQFAVAEVILNRVDRASFPSTPCRVINQGTGKKFRCQFTYKCDGNSEQISEPAAWAQVGKVARIMLDGKTRELTGGATNYHTRAVRPSWSRVFPRTASIGAHHFYRQPIRTVSNR